jgi:hypothetical protein
MLPGFGRTLALLLIVQFSLSSCAATARGTLQPLTAPQGQIEAGNSVALRIVSDSSEVGKDVAARLRERLFGALVAEGLFKQVLPGSEAAEYVLEVTLADTKQVSTASRIWLGSMGGRNRAMATVRLTKTGTTEPVRSFTSTAESAAHPGSADSSMDAAVRLLAQQILKGLRG